MNELDYGKIIQRDVEIANGTFTKNKKSNTEKIAKMIESLGKKVESLSNSAENSLANTCRRQAFLDNKLREISRLKEKISILECFLWFSKENKLEYTSYLNNMSQFDFLYKLSKEKTNRIYSFDFYSEYINKDFLKHELKYLNQKCEPESYEVLVSIINKKSNEYGYVKVNTEEEIKSIQVLKKYSGWWILESTIKDFKIKNSLKITNESIMRLALFEFIRISGYSAFDDSKEKMKKREIEILNSNPGIDFFPTPDAVIDKIFELVDLTKESKVLEPSAGSGNIALRIKEFTDNIDVVELSQPLCELLSMKGFSPFNFDFMDFGSEEDYDFVIMNPPFSQDTEHVKKAFELLKDGGKLISVLPVSVMSNTTGKYRWFREWLNDSGIFYEFKELPQNSFMDRNQAKTTSVSCCLLLIEK